jgi:DHA2 family multidrug resistance protein
LFLVNVLPGILSAFGGFAYLARDRQEPSRPRLDLVALFFLATGLSALVLALKDAPHKAWMSLPVVALLTWTLVASGGLLMCSRRGPSPLVDLSLFSNREFAVGSALSFVLGIGLFGSVYLMPVFLAYVRGQDAFEIGRIMLVTGLA